MTSVILMALLALPTAQGRTADDRATLMKNAADALQSGRRAEAKQLLQTAGERFQSVQALLQLARLQSGDGDAAGAMTTLRRARTIAPNSEDVLFAFAQVALATRAPVPAILTLESLTRLCPSVAQYHYLLGVGLMTAGDMEAALEALGTANTLEPDRPLTLTALGLAYNNRKRFDEARSVLSRSLELKADSIETMAALAEAEAGLSNLDQAERHAAGVLAGAPDNATANLVMGMVRTAQQRYAEARDALLAAVKADPRSPKPEYQLSLVYSRLGEEDNARQHVASYQQKLRDMEGMVKALHSTGFGGDGRQ